VAFFFAWCSEQRCDFRIEKIGYKIAIKLATLKCPFNDWTRPPFTRPTSLGNSLTISGDGVHWINAQITTARTLVNLYTFHHIRDHFSCYYKAQN